MKSDGASKLLKLCTAAAIIAAAPVTSTFAQDAAKKPAAPAAAAKKPATPPKPITEVKKEDFRVSVTLPAVFEATKLTEVKVLPKVWTDLTVVSAVEHGTRVKKGTRLVQLDLKKLEEQITALEAASETAKLTHQTLLDGLATMEKTNPMELEAAKRAKREADLTLERWIEKGHDQAKESYKRSLASSERSLEYAQEELNQLQKMYDEDDLTEETEEIILKRAKISVEQSKYYYERAKDSYDYAMKYGIQRQHQSQLNSHKRATIAHDLAVRTIPRSLALKRLEIAKAKEDARKAAKNFSDLKRDLALLKDVKSPAAGVVYYGKSTRGAWSSADAAKKLISGGKLAAKVPFMTIVGEGTLRAQTAIPENKLAMLSSGAKGHITPTSNPLLKIPATLGKINYAASPIGFKTSASLKVPEKSNVMPGMKGSLVFTTADRKGVITVPVTAISREGNKSFVYMPKDGADPEKREVKTAETDGKKVVVLSGLVEKDKVLTVAP